MALASTTLALSSTTAARGSATLARGSATLARGAAAAAWMTTALMLVSCGGDSGSGGSASTSATSTASTGAGGAGGAAGLSCGEPFVTKGPWALRVNESSVVVRWEACDEAAAGGIEISPEQGGDSFVAESIATPTTLAATYETPLNPDAPPDYAGTYFLHEAAVTGLAPSTCYGYALRADPSRAGRFCTARASGEAFSFVAIGDTNPALGTTDETIAALLPSNPDFTLHLGDLQYYDSLLETWAFWFPVMQPLLSQGAFLPIIGNHEYEVPSELDEYALRFFGDAGFDGSRSYHRYESGGVWFFGLNSEEPFGPEDPQGKWLVDGLAEVRQKPGFRFSVVSVHRPMLTCGDSGDLPDAFAAFDPIFAESQVLFVLAGHMHGYERFELGRDPTYITTAGGGGAIRDPSENLSRPYCDSRAVVGDYYHSIVFDVDADTVTGRVIDREGVVRDTFEKAIPAPP